MNTKKKQKNRAPIRGRSVNLSSQLHNNVRSYPNQPLATHRMDSISVVGTTAITTGAISLVIDADPTALIQSWGTRFSNTYEEYRLIKCVAEVACFSSVNPGLIAVVWDETTATPLNQYAAQERAQLRFAAGDVTRVHRLTWSATDLRDLAYSLVSVSSVPARFKLYTDSPSFGSSIVATPYLSVTLKMTVQFRGFIAA